MRKVIDSGIGKGKTVVVVKKFGADDGEFGDKSQIKGKEVLRCFLESLLRKFKDGQFGK